MPIIELTGANAEAFTGNSDASAVAHNASSSWWAKSAKLGGKIVNGAVNGSAKTISTGMRGLMPIVAYHALPITANHSAQLLGFGDVSKDFNFATDLDLAKGNNVLYGAMVAQTASEVALLPSIIHGAYDFAESTVNLAGKAIKHSDVGNKALNAAAELSAPIKQVVAKAGADMIAGNAALRVGSAGLAFMAKPKFALPAMVGVEASSIVRGLQAGNAKSVRSGVVGSGGILLGCAAGAVFAGPVGCVGGAFLTNLSAHLYDGVIDPDNTFGNWAQDQAQQMINSIDDSTYKAEQCAEALAKAGVKAGDLNSKNNLPANCKAPSVNVVRTHWR